MTKFKSNNVSLPEETCAVEMLPESSVSRSKQAVQTLQPSITEIVGKDLNDHIENSSLSAITSALEYIGSEIIFGCNYVVLCSKSDIVPFIFQARSKRKSTEAQERKVLNKGTEK